MTVFTTLAPAKVNLGLLLGPTRPQDGKHELATVMQSISLADELTLRPAPDGTTADAVLCPGVEGDNLAATALAAFREATGWDAPAQQLEIVKRIPVAAGLGGGSADAAAALRLAQAASGLGNEDLLRALAGQLGADVPAQVAPGRWLAGGAGERLERLPDPASPLAILVVPSDEQLSTAAVYKEADRLGAQRTSKALAERADDLRSALARGAALPAAGELLHNDLQRAAVSLCPSIATTLEQLQQAGADPERILVSGSGPTVLAVFARTPGVPQGELLAELVRERLAEHRPPATIAQPVTPSFVTICHESR
jgi:4-diphosphocytidyl-2-C-methyl-D-erythritol kinase